MRSIFFIPMTQDSRLIMYYTTESIVLIVVVVVYLNDKRKIHIAHTTKQHNSRPTVCLSIRQ